MIELRVAFADTDAMGIVHHANYFRYFEVARVEWMRQKGLEYRTFQESGRHLPLIESQCKYKKPAKFDDILQIKIKSEVKGLRVSLTYEVTRKETGELLATGATEHVCVGHDLKLTPLPEELLRLFETGDENGSQLSP